MHDLTLDETLLAKASFGQRANKGGVNIDSYCATMVVLLPLDFNKL
jgi:hypothetical protein